MFIGLARTLETRESILRADPEKREPGSYSVRTNFYGIAIRITTKESHQDR
jgi:hypothetical protein